MAYFHLLVADNELMPLIQGVTLTLNDKNNGSNAFPVPEDLGVDPLSVFI